MQCPHTQTHILSDAHSSHPCLHKDWKTNSGSGKTDEQRCVFAPQTETINIHPLSLFFFFSFSHTHTHTHTQTLTVHVPSTGENILFMVLCCWCVFLNWLFTYIIPVHFTCELLWIKLSNNSM